MPIGPGGQEQHYLQKVLLLLSPNNAWIYIGLKTIGVKTFQSPAKLQQSVVVVCRAQQSNEPIGTLAINQLAFNAFAALIKIQIFGRRFEKPFLLVLCR